VLFSGIFLHEVVCHYSAPSWNPHLSIEVTVICKPQGQIFVLLEYAPVKFIGSTYYNFDLTDINICF
jgi:hypothetical protein